MMTRSRASLSSAVIFAWNNSVRKKYLYTSDIRNMKDQREIRNVMSALLYRYCRWTPYSYTQLHHTSPHSVTHTYIQYSKITVNRLFIAIDEKVYNMKCKLMELTGKHVRDQRVSQVMLC